MVVALVKSVQIDSRVDPLDVEDIPHSLVGCIRQHEMLS